MDSPECRKLLRVHQSRRCLGPCLKAHYGRKEVFSLQLVVIQIRIGSLRQLCVDDEFDLGIVDSGLFEEAEEWKFRTSTLKVGSHCSDPSRRLTRGQGLPNR